MPGAAAARPRFFPVYLAALTVRRRNIAYWRPYNYIHIVGPDRPLSSKMELAMLGFLVWLVLLFLCWPIALLALVMYPLVWLVLLPFRLLGIGFEAVFELLRAIVMLPARVLGGGVGR